MYKLLIVDDEPEVTEGLLEEIDWTVCGFSGVWSAGNGREAMEMFEKTEPDVLVTDINMPYMNGLELAEWAKKTYPLTRIVILSGHDEFEYAKQAIQLQADDYLLKPFSDDQLIAAIRETVRRMDEERERRSNVELLQEHYRISLPILREKFLSSLVTRRQSRLAIRDKAEKYGVNLDGRSFIASVIGVQARENDDGENGENRARRPKLADDLDLMLFSVSNVAEEIWFKRGLGRAFIHQDQVVLLTVSPHSEASRAMEETQDGLKEILQSIEKFLALPIAIGVGTLIRDIGSLKSSYQAALDALDYRRIVGAGRIIYIGDMESIEEKLTFDEAKERSLTRAVKVGSEEELRETIDALFGELARIQASVQVYEVYMLEMVTAILKLTKDIQGGSDELFGGGVSLLNQYRKLNSVEETKAWFVDLCVKLRGRIASGRQRASKQIVEEAIAYARSNFQDSELSIAKVCEHLHISAGYFSGLFKKETQMTFGAYLLQLRMEKTMELLRTTNLKTFEIADRVGFSDPNYLGLCFKKYAGQTPKEYRAGLPETSG
ncbi:response regulator [Cohnella thailandensis]|uniref:Response regulator n=1 Tax=Cohnella thailandensis TaxID=557557 RepID=A0A841SX27_9BACL|nr:response regulator [Cohnella thailandensis]MBB6636803.1 response regulator [Cohnella thailandensis]MBP1973320.1 two-component system response regulator YesN [Cohnella thailandensis]